MPGYYHLTKQEIAEEVGRTETPAEEERGAKGISQTAEMDAIYNCLRLSGLENILLQ